MFISIVRTPDDGESRNHTSMYECDLYHIHPIEGDVNQWTVTLEKYGNQPAISFTYATTEKALGIYVMNKDGRTIDTIFRSR